MVVADSPNLGEAMCTRLEGRLRAKGVDSLPDCKEDSFCVWVEREDKSGEREGCCLSGCWEDCLSE